MSDFAENELVFDEEQEELPLTLAEKITNYATIALTMLLLGGSIVFWWIVSKYLLFNPSNLVDAKLMGAVLLCCAVVPVIVTAVQALLKRPVDIERWIVCMCVSGALSAMLAVLYQLGIRHTEFTFRDLPTLLCCTVSGCALPSVILLGIRRLVPAIAARVQRPEPYTRASWDAVKQDVLSLTDFDI